MVKVLLKRVGRVNARQLRDDIAKITRITVSAHANNAPHIEIYSRRELSDSKESSTRNDAGKKPLHTY